MAIKSSAVVFNFAVVFLERSAQLAEQRWIWSDQSMMAENENVRCVSVNMCG
jgi:hypothetical protein